MIKHDTRPCTPFGHSAYRGYDATKGKIAQLAEQARSVSKKLPVCRCCGKWFGSFGPLRDHMRSKHGVSQ